MERFPGDRFQPEGLAGPPRRRVLQAPLDGLRDPGGRSRRLRFPTDPIILVSSIGNMGGAFGCLPYLIFRGEILPKVQTSSLLRATKTFVSASLVLLLALGTS